MKNAKEKFLICLQEAIDILKPFVDEVNSGSLRWDGEKYSPAKELRHCDPFALSWSSCLQAIKCLIQHQSEPLSEGQKQYLQSELFGGMGSFHDFSISEKLYVEEAKEANKQLSSAVEEMYQAFKLLE